MVKRRIEVENEKKERKKKTRKQEKNHLNLKLM